jgi:ribosomal-protein-alanine N-acetyltransferase
VSGLYVEEAEAQDVPILLEIERSSYSHPWTRRNFEGELRAPQSLFLVVREAAGKAAAAADRGVRAYCAFRMVVDEMHLMNLTVSPRAQGRGLGRFLLGLALGLAARRGSKTALLEVRESNARALALYRAAGFSLQGRRPGYYNHPREDALLLGRPLVLPEPNRS